MVGVNGGLQVKENEAQGTLLQRKGRSGYTKWATKIQSALFIMRGARFNFGIDQTKEQKDETSGTAPNAPMVLWQSELASGCFAGEQKSQERHATASDGGIITTSIDYTSCQTNWTYTDCRYQQPSSSQRRKNIFSLIVPNR